MLCLDDGPDDALLELLESQGSLPSGGESLEAAVGPAAGAAAAPTDVQASVGPDNNNTNNNNIDNDNGIEDDNALLAAYDAYLHNEGYFNRPGFDASTTCADPSSLTLPTSSAQTPARARSRSPLGEQLGPPMGPRPSQIGNGNLMGDTRSTSFGIGGSFGFYSVGSLMAQHFLGPSLGIAWELVDMPVRQQLRAENNISFALLQRPTSSQLEHCYSIIERCYISLGKRFYLGITEVPCDRRAAHADASNRPLLKIIMIGESSTETGDLEIRLLTGLRLRHHVLCENEGPGGEGRSKGRPHYLYISHR